MAKALLSSVPSGTVAPYAGTVAPVGYLLCNGNVLSRAEFPSLFQAIGTAFGDGSKNPDGSNTGFVGTHFNLPDTRGTFLRGVDGGKGLDADRGARTAQFAGGNTGDAVGSVQGDENKSHNHTSYPATGTNWYNVYSRADGTWPDERAGNTRTSPTTHTGGSESRPKNVNINYIIKI